MIKGVDAYVSRPVKSGTDRLGNPVVEYADPVTVHNVLVAPGASMDMEAERPEGVTVALTLHFPKSWNGSLEGCLVTLPAPWAGVYRVIGAPMPYADVNTPTPWHMSVEVEVAHG